MRMRLFGWGLLAAGVLACTSGCNKPAETKVLTQPPAQNPETIARIHWLGKERLGAETNAAYFMSLWRMPEAARLEAQTLDKLALALEKGALGHGLAVSGENGGKRMEDSAKPAPSAGTNSGLSTLNSQLPASPQSDLSRRSQTKADGGGSTNSPLRPLLDDVVQKESYFEARQAGSNAPVELALAIRLSPERAALWQTNLAGTGAQVSRQNDWTLVTLAGSNRPPFVAVLSAIQAPPATAAVKGPSAWLEANLDLAQLGDLLSFLTPPPATLPRSDAPMLLGSFSTNLPRLIVRCIGDGRNVHTAAELELSRPLGLQLDPWNVPTNLVQEPLIGFMAVRGIRPWLASLPFWSDLSLGPAPNQAYFWAQRGLQRFHFMAVPSLDASNQVVKLSQFVLDTLNPIIATNALKIGIFEPRTNSPGVGWRGFPLLSPNLAYTNLGANPFILAGFSPTILSNKPAPDALFQQLYGGTNLVWYDWERTGDCTDGLGQLAQMARHLFSKARLTHTVGLDWLIATAPKLGPAVTGVMQIGPNQLKINRSSTTGFTGVELQLFIDWLESPEFPHGLHTFLAAVQPKPTAPTVAAPQETNAATNANVKAPNAR